MYKFGFAVIATVVPGSENGAKPDGGYWTDFNFAHALISITQRSDAPVRYIRGECTKSGGDPARSMPFDASKVYDPTTIVLDPTTGEKLSISQNMLNDWRYAQPTSAFTLLGRSAERGVGSMDVLHRRRRLPLISGLR